MHSFIYMAQIHSFGVVKGLETPKSVCHVNKSHPCTCYHAQLQFLHTAGLCTSTMNYCPKYLLVCLCKNLNILCCIKFLIHSFVVMLAHQL